MTRICWGRSTGCFIYSFVNQVICEKTLSSKGFTSNFKDILNENNLTIIPTDLVTNSLWFLFLSFLTNQKQESGFQQVGGLVTRNISVFCLLQVALYLKAMSNSIDFYKSFLTCSHYTRSYHSSMYQQVHIWLVTWSIMHNLYFGSSNTLVK